METPPLLPAIGLEDVQERTSEEAGFTPEEATRRIAVAIEKCPQSDVYEYTSLITTAWHQEDIAEEECTAFEELPPKDVALLQEALEGHEDVHMVRHSWGMVRVMRPHDSERYQLFEMGARILAMGLQDKLGDGAAIGYDDFLAIARQYGMLPTDPEERDRFSRAFAYCPGVEIGDDGIVRLHKHASDRKYTVNGNQHGQRIGAVVGGLLLDKLDFSYTPPDRQPVPRKPHRKRSRQEPAELPQAEPSLAQQHDAKPVEPKRRRTLLSEFESFTFAAPPSMTEEHKQLVELYKVALKNQIINIVDAAYKSWPLSRIITDHMLRMELFMRQYPEMARPILKDLVRNDPRFEQYQKTTIFMVVKPEASPAAPKKLRQEIERQRVLAKHTAQALVAGAGRVVRHKDHRRPRGRDVYKQDVPLQRILTTAARIDPHADLAILYPFLRNDPRLYVDDEERWFIRPPVET